MDLLAAAAGGLLVGVLATALVARLLSSASRAPLSTERDLLRERVVDLEEALLQDAQTATELAPLRDALGRVERQVGVLERDRMSQFARIGSQLETVSTSTEALRAQTASLAGSLQSSAVRGTWGEVQLRRVLEHAGMLARCDFGEQVSGVTAHERGVRPDVVVRMPGDKCLVVDAKAPMSSFLAAHGREQEELSEPERARLLAAHASSLRGHVETLAGKAYWSAFATSPELVVCFLPADAILASALAADPTLFDHAMGRRVVLCAPGTLLALLRTVAYCWQQESLTENARTLLGLGQQLYARLGSLADHASAMGRSLHRTVESYNALVGSLESRVLVTARAMHGLDLASEEVGRPAPLEATTRPLTAAELLDALDVDVGRPDLPLDELSGARDAVHGSTVRDTA